MTTANQRTASTVGDRLEGGSVAIVAEIGQSHEGSIENALRAIDVAAATGVDAVKFQLHIADAESTTREPWRVDPHSGRSRQEYWRSMEFTLEQWRRIRDRCNSHGVEFFASPFSPEALDVLLNLGVHTVKLSSGEALNAQLVDLVAGLDLRVVASNGLMNNSEVDALVAHLQRAGNELILLQCTTRYPTAPKETALASIPEMRNRYNCHVGISDHSGTIFPSIAATALGASMIEVHLAIDASESNLDLSSSISAEALAELVQGVRFVEESRNVSRPVQLSPETTDLRLIFGRSLVAARTIERGQEITEPDLAYRKPAGGLGWTDRRRIVGRRARRLIGVNELIRDEDVK